MQVYPSADLAKLLSTLGVQFLQSDPASEPPLPLPPAQLFEELANHPDARFRQAIIPLLLLNPDWAQEATKAASSLQGADRIRFEILYTAAMLLQQEHAIQLEILLGSQPLLPDLFSSDLGIPEHGPPRQRLAALAEMHRKSSRLAVNWIGTYEHAAERFIKRLEHEAEWAKLPQAK